jgi:hypothetical protein
MLRSFSKLFTVSLFRHFGERFTVSLFHHFVKHFVLHVLRKTGMRNKFNVSQKCHSYRMFPVLRNKNQQVVQNPFLVLGSQRCFSILLLFQKMFRLSLFREIDAKKAKISRNSHSFYLFYYIAQQQYTVSSETLP